VGKDEAMSSHSDTVTRYFDGFRRSDHEQILGLLTDDVVWHLPGQTHLEGKDAFDGEIENPAFDGSPTLRVDRLVEQADTVVAIGEGAGTLTGGGGVRFAFCTVLTFRGDLISRVDSYVVPLPAA
jgi:ketosteroid isomerase-like protein